MEMWRAFSWLLRVGLPLLFSTALYGQTYQQRAQAYLDSIYHAGHFPGISTAVTLADGRTFAFTAGYNDTTLKLPLKATDRLMEGSVGKTYAAAIAYELIRDGKLSLDDPVSKYLGSESWYARVPNAKDITVRMIMTHTSGVMRYELDSLFLVDLTAQPDKRWSVADRLRYVLDKPAPFEAGKGWDYSDTNFILLGAIVEQITKQPLNSLIASHLLKPLGLTETVASESRSVPGLAQGYAGPNNPFGGVDAMIANGRFAVNPQFEWAGGGYSSTAADLSRWGMLLYSGKAVGADIIQTAVSAGITAPMLGPGWTYGLGVMMHPTPLGPMWGHAGFFPGYMAELRYYPERKISVAALVNTSQPRTVGRPLWRIAEALATITNEAIASGELRN